MEELAGLGLLATPDKPVPRAIEWEDIQKLTYLNAVIKVRFLKCRDICAGRSADIRFF